MQHCSQLSPVIGLIMIVQCCTISLVVMLRQRKNSFTKHKWVCVYERARCFGFNQSKQFLLVQNKQQRGNASFNLIHCRLNCQCGSVVNVKLSISSVTSRIPLKCSQVMKHCRRIPALWPVSLLAPTIHLQLTLLSMCCGFSNTINFCSNA